MGKRNITRIMVRDDRPETPCYKRFPDTHFYICNTIIKWMMLWFSLRYGSCNHRDCEQVSIEIVMFNFALNFSVLIQTEFWTGNIDGMGMGVCQLEEFPSLTRKYRRKAFKGTHLHFHWVLDVFKYKIYKFSPSSCLKLDLNVRYFCVH